MLPHVLAVSLQSVGRLVYTFRIALTALRMRRAILLPTLFVGIFALTACQKTAVVTNQATTNQAAQDANTTQQASKIATNEPITTNVEWQKTEDGWMALGTPPTCPTPLTLTSPVDVSKATAVLYPGQTRGGNYKAHGGFLFRGLANADVSVKVPLDAQVVQGSRYIEQGEVQYLFDLQSPCGIRVRFDHLLTLSPAFAALAEQLPAAQVNNSQSTKFQTPYAVKTGDAVATAVGFAKTKSVTVDFGVYDLRQKNVKSQDVTWAADHSPEQAHYAVCWLDWLSGADSAKAKALPGGDQNAGKTSDFCS